MRRRKKHKRIRPRNIAAEALASPLHKLRVVKPKKGKGSYRRRTKHARGRRVHLPINSS